MLTNKLCIELKNIARNFIPAKYLDDLTQEVFLQLLEMPKAKVNDLIASGDIHRYFNRMCKLNYYSKNSRYYYTYVKIYEHILFHDSNKSYNDKKQKHNDLYIKEDSDLIDQILKELYWYDRELFKLYVLGDKNCKKYTYTSLSAKTGISRISIYYTIKGVKKHITNRLKELRNDL